MKSFPHRRRIHRHYRLRATIRGTIERPRLSVFRSLKHLTVQIIDDTAGRTLAAATDRHLPASTKKITPVDKARALGQLIAERAKAVGITRVVFDRGGHAYHGQVRALAEGARQKGLEF